MMSQNERDGFIPMFIIGILSIVLLLVFFNSQMQYDEKKERLIKELEERRYILEESDRNILDNF